MQLRLIDTTRTGLSTSRLVVLASFFSFLRRGPPLAPPTSFPLVLFLPLVEAFFLLHLLLLLLSLLSTWRPGRSRRDRRRRRRLYHRTRAALLNLMLISLNWETLGFPSEAPPEASVGSYHTAQQHEAVERLETGSKAHKSAIEPCDMPGSLLDECFVMQVLRPARRLSSLCLWGVGLGASAGLHLLVRLPPAAAMPLKAFPWSASWIPGCPDRGHSSGWLRPKSGGIVCRKAEVPPVSCCWSSD